jgi:hypothetical protein
MEYTLGHVGCRVLAGQGGRKLGDGTAWRQVFLEERKLCVEVRSKREKEKNQLN